MFKWIRKLFGDNTKSIGFEDNELNSIDNTEDAYDLAWRNKYLAARIKYLDDLITKNRTSDIFEPSPFILPENVETGSIKEITQIGEQLADRVQYLEDYISSNFPKIKLNRS